MGTRRPVFGFSKVEYIGHRLATGSATAAIHLSANSSPPYRAMRWPNIRSNETLNTQKDVSIRSLGERFSKSVDYYLLIVAILSGVAVLTLLRIDDPNGCNLREERQGYARMLRRSTSQFRLRQEETRRVRWRLQNCAPIAPKGCDALQASTPA